MGLSRHKFDTISRRGVSVTFSPQAACCQRAVAQRETSVVRGNCVRFSHQNSRMLRCPPIRIHPCNNVLLKGMSRKKCSPSAQCRSFFLGIQPTRLNVHSYFRVWSSSAPRSYFVPACEAEKRCSSVVPFLLP